MRRGCVVPKESEQVIVVLRAEECGVDHGLEGVEDVFVDGVAGSLSQGFV